VRLDNVAAGARRQCASDSNLALLGGRSSSPLGPYMRAFPSFLLLSVALTIGTSSFAQSANHQGFGCGSLPLEQVFAASRTVTLVRVLESTYTEDFNIHFRDNAAATLVVERYWRGPFNVGDTIQAVMRIPCFGFDCRPYPFQAGQKALILTPEVNDPVHTTDCTVVDGDRVKDTMEALDDLLRKSVGPNPRLERP
jgi:hypothetical protein